MTGENVSFGERKPLRIVTFKLRLEFGLEGA